MTVTFRRRSTVVVPPDPGVGTNLKGNLSGGAWLHLLPALAGSRALIVGPPYPGDIPALTRAGFEVVQVESPGDLATRLPPTDGSPPRFDLIVVSTPLEGVSPALTEVLAAGGALIAFDLNPPPAPPTGFSLRPVEFVSEGDRLRSAMVAGDRLTAYDFRSNGRVARRQRLTPGRLPTRSTQGAILTSAGVPALPHVLTRLVEEGALPPAPRWGMWARGDYNSQKILMFAYPPDGYRPEVAIKITRSPDANTRLANEYLALQILGELGHVDQGRAPGALYLSTAHGCCLCAETAVHGTPFDELSRPARLDLLADAGHWLTDLGRSTMNIVPGSRLVDSLTPDLERFVTIFGQGVESEALGGAMSELAACPSIPMVAQHGDAGAWNLLADSRGRTVFLDWESFRTTGPPLWDLLYLVRSFAARFHGRRRRRLRELAIDRHLFQGSRLTPHLARTIDRQVTALELDPALIEPLMLTGWMHRAVKEASRLTPARVGSSRYLRLIRRTIGTRGSRGHALMTGREHPW